MKEDAIKDLLFRLADDALIMGHRCSEWIGLGPVLEEDIAMGSLAQDEVGQALSYYQLLHELGEADPDTLAFQRKAPQYRCCKFVELPNESYAFTLVRHLLYDFAKQVRLQALVHSSYKPLQDLAKKIIREQKYHTMHAASWITQLAAGSEEAKTRIQTACDQAYPWAWGLFEATEQSITLAETAVQPQESELLTAWSESVQKVLQAAGIEIPPVADVMASLGGRQGQHTEHLAPLLAEMTSVYDIDPGAQW